MKHVSIALFTALALSITATACSDSDDTGDAQFPVCAEDDFGASPFAGPGFDAETGLIGAVKDRYVVSSTHTIFNPEAEDRFFALSGDVLGYLGSGQHPGFIGFSVGTSDRCGSARTMTVWESEQSMFDFVTSEAHLAAMNQVDDVLLIGGFAHWDVSSDNVPPTWDEARAEVATTAALAY